MERNFVPEAWIGERVMIVRFSVRGASLPEQRGWLIGASDEGMMFAQESWDDFLGKLVPETAIVYPWSTLALVKLLSSEHLH